MKHNDITVILLLYQTPKKLIQNLDNYKDFKILILDQSNDYKTQRFLLTKYKNIVYYKVSNKNLGFSRGQNFLINKVRTKYFFSTQLDIYIKKENILKLKKLLKKFNNNLFVVPNINKNFKISRKKYLNVKEMIGAAFMAKTLEFKKFAMFDENFFFYWEDIDLNERVKKSKFKIMTDTTSEALHLSGSSTVNNFRARYIRDVNFRFGEYLFKYKYKKLRILKMSRELFLNTSGLIFNIIFLNMKKIEKNFFNLLGIFKFIQFAVRQKLNYIVK